MKRGITMTNNKKEFFIERTNENGSYTVVSSYDTYDEAIEGLKAVESGLRHE